MKEKVLYGTRQGEPDYCEQLLCTQPARFDEVKRMATRDGFNRFRVAVIDLSIPPDFSKTINQ